MDAFHTAATSAWIALRCDHPEIEGFGELGKPCADRAEADDEQRVSAKFFFPLRRIADHPAPVLLFLMITARMELTRQSQDQCHGVLADSIVDCALGTCEQHSLFPKTLQIVLIRPSTDGLHEAQTGSPIQKLVPPESRCHDH